MSLGSDLVKKSLRGLMNPANDVDALSAVRKPKGSPVMDEPFTQEEPNIGWRANDNPQGKEGMLPWRTPPTSPQQVEQALQYFNDALRKFDTRRLEQLSQTFFGRPWDAVKASLMPHLNLDF